MMKLLEVFQGPEVAMGQQQTSIWSQVYSVAYEGNGI